MMGQKAPGAWLPKHGQYKRTTVVNVVASYDTAAQSDRPATKKIPKVLVLSIFNTVPRPSLESVTEGGIADSE